MKTGYLRGGGHRVLRLYGDGFQPKQFTLADEADFAGDAVGLD
jgi:hypothetical protein